MRRHASAHRAIGRDDVRSLGIGLCGHRLREGDRRDALWGSEDAMRASEESANALRAHAAEDIQATAAPKVERYEVAVVEYF